MRPGITGLLLVVALLSADASAQRGLSPRGGAIGRAGGPVGPADPSFGRSVPRGNAIPADRMGNRPGAERVPIELIGTGYAASLARMQRMGGIRPRSYTFEETGEELSYAVFVPKRVDEDEPAPLVIALHGMGGQPENILVQVSREANRRGYIVAAPMGYNPYGGYGAYPAGLGPNPDPGINELSEADVMHVLDRVREEFNVDSRRIYLLGQSMGGAGALYLGRKYGDIWAAVGATAPAVGNGEPLGLEAVRDLPFVIVHGDADQAVPVERSRRWVAKMKSLDMTVEYYEVRHGGHSDAIVKGAPYVFDFFDEHTRSERPGEGGVVPGHP